MLCCIGCAIFGVTELSTNGIDFETGDFAYQNAEEGKMPAGAAAAAAPPAPASIQPTSAYVPPPPQPQAPQQTVNVSANAALPGTQSNAVASEPSDKQTSDQLQGSAQTQKQTENEMPNVVDELD